MIATAVLLTLAIGLRNQVGGDWWNYLYVFQRIRGSSFSTALTVAEPGYVAVNWIAWKAGWGIWFPNLVCAAIFSWGVVSFCRQQPNPWLALTVATYIIILLGMGLTRQSAALGFVMLAMVQYSRGGLVKMGAYLVGAVMFHSSAIIMAPIIGLAVARRGVGTAIVTVLLGAIFLYQFSSGIFVLLTRYTETTHTAGGAVPRLLMNLIPALIFLSFPTRLTRTASEQRLWTIISLMTFVSVFLLFFVRSSAIVDRLGLYITPLQIYVLSRLPAAFGTRTRENMFLLSLVVAFSLAVEITWLRYGTWGHAWLPYRNYIWDATTGKVPPRWYRHAQ